MEKHEICKLIISRIKQYLSSPECLEAHREKNHFIHKHKLTMLHLVTYLFYSTKASMSQNLASIIVSAKKSGGSLPQLIRFIMDSNNVHFTMFKVE